jgi:uncharacterized membrane protein YdbT with pleckstrin-like domain
MFEGQRPDEKIIFITKKHPAILFRPALWLTLLTLLPIFAFIYFKFSWVFSYSFFFWLIFGGAYGFRTWYCFKNSQYILTNERLIKKDQKGIFHKTVSEAPLEKIQDVSFEIKGFWPSMWDYGTIYVKTGTEAGKIVLECLEEPQKIQEQILEGVKPATTEDTEKKQTTQREKPDIPKKIKKINDFWD